MMLATSCGYPTGYFNDLSADNDEDLEVERNDVRDIIRSISGGGDNAITACTLDVYCQTPSICILERMVDACAAAIILNNAATTKQLPPETAVHVLSALAKPLNALAKLFASDTTTTVAAVAGREKAARILNTALHSLGHVCSIIVDCFASPSWSVVELLPVSRLASLATASFSPLFSFICSVIVHNNDKGGGVDVLEQTYRHTLRSSIYAAASSLSNIPELTSASSLDVGDTRYDIIGAMRGPGGEDHVGCLALLRLATESDLLSYTVMDVMSSSSTTNGNNSTLNNGDNDNKPKSAFIIDLFHLHEKLRSDELERGPGVFHGEGVTPKTRRILLNIISHLSLLMVDDNTPTNKDGQHQNNAATSLSQEEQDEILQHLQKLFHAPIMSIVESSKNADLSHAEKIFLICESAFDLSSFPSRLTSTLFSNENHQSNAFVLEGVQSMINVAVSGYMLNPVQEVATRGSPDMMHVQWGRLRGALILLFCSCANRGLPALAVDALISLNNAECQSIIHQCNAGPASLSNIFDESVISEDVVPAGAFVIVVNNALEGILSMSSKQMVNAEELAVSSKECVRALDNIRESVFQTIVHPSPEAESGSHVDPRPTLAEAWYLTMITLVSVCNKCGSVGMGSYGSVLNRLLSESASTAVLILFNQGVDKKEREDRVIGMSVDGPHTFAMINFLEKVFSIGGLLQLVSQQLVSRLKLDFHGVPTGSKELSGAAVIFAALLRGASGGLPPWAIEGLPSLFSAFYTTCGSSNVFCEIMHIAIGIRLENVPDAAFGCATPGKKLAGRFFETMGEKHVNEFLSKAKEICEKNDADAWRRFKATLKKVCGGKKKDSGFNLKPTFTNWDCERI